MLVLVIVLNIDPYRLTRKRKKKKQEKKSRLKALVTLLFNTVS